MVEAASIVEQIRNYLDDPNSELPVFDQNSLVIMEEASKPDPDVSRIISLIMQDQALTAEVLKLANSSFFRGIKQVSRIQDAVVRIGLREVVNHVLLFSQHKNYTASSPLLQQYISALWTQSVACAYGAQWLTIRCGHSSLSPEAFVAGLLHDIGKLLVIKALTDIAEKHKDAPRLTKAAANEFISTLHPDAGYNLLRKWNLPEVYCTVCRDHHLIDYDPKNIILVVVRLANAACKKLGFGLAHDPDLVLAACGEAEALRLGDVALAELEIAMEDYVSKCSD